MSMIWRFPEIGLPLNHPFVDGISMKSTIQLPSGKRLRKKITIFSWEHLLFLWPCSSQQTINVITRG